MSTKIGPADAERGEGLGLPSRDVGMPPEDAMIQANKGKFRKGAHRSGGETLLGKTLCSWLRMFNLLLFKL